MKILNEGPQTIHPTSRKTYYELFFLHISSKMEENNSKHHKPHFQCWKPNEQIWKQ
jgi:hypothetical protein